MWISVAPFIFEDLAGYMEFIAFGQDFEFVESTKYYFASLLFGVGPITALVPMIT